MHSLFSPATNAVTIFTMESPQSSSFQTLEGKVAIVTGASRGLGLGFAFELARRGAKVRLPSLHPRPGRHLTLTRAQIVATYTSPSSETSVRDLASRIAALDKPSQCISVRADLRDPASAAEIVRQCVAAFGPRIDILVNNAGAELVKPLTDISPADFDSIYHLNVLAPLLLLQAVKPHLPSNGSGGGGGRIINISSVGARHGFRDLSLYCSSKAALEGMTRCWAAELGAGGHTVNAVNPGPVQSEMLENIPGEIVRMQKEQTPVEKRLGTVDDVAQVVAWLASEESRWVTGQTLSVSGGWAMY